jgi:hypothetical protein
MDIFQIDQRLKPALAKLYPTEPPTSAMVSSMIEAPS